MFFDASHSAGANKQRIAQQKRALTRGMQQDKIFSIAIIESPQLVDIYGRRAYNIDNYLCVVRKGMDYIACFKALGDETRLEIIELLKGGTKCACKLLERFAITQPTLSYHMKALVDCGLVCCEKKGIWNHYTLNREALLALSKSIVLTDTITAENEC